MRLIVCCTLLLAAWQTAYAQDCCEQCGCHACCQKVCHVVCELKKVPKITYDCECEEFCVPGPSTCCKCVDECGCTHRVYTPGCGKVRTRTKLVKHETMEEKPSYKWTVEYLCRTCAHKAEACQRSQTDEPDADASGAALPPPVVGGVDAASAVDEPSKTAPSGTSGAKHEIRRLLTPLVGRR